MEPKKIIAMPQENEVKAVKAALTEGPLRELYNGHCHDLDRAVERMIEVLTVLNTAVLELGRELTWVERRLPRVLRNVDEERQWKILGYAMDLRSDLEWLAARIARVVTHLPESSELAEGLIPNRLMRPS